MGIELKTSFNGILSSLEREAVPSCIDSMSTINGGSGQGPGGHNAAPPPPPQPTHTHIRLPLHKENSSERQCTDVKYT